MAKTEEKIEQKNQVLRDDYQPSRNFYRSDRILRHLLTRECSGEGLSFMEERLQKLGEQAAGVMNELSMRADKNGPELVKRNWLGEKRDEIRFHPAYEELTRIAVDSGMFYVKWDPELRHRFREERHRLGFAAGFLFAMSESGLYCPLCMTDGAARLVDRYCSEEDRTRLLPHIYTRNAGELYTGAMFLTEKSGGSDVGANLVSAEPHRDDYHLLNGEKWFCSNADAEIIFALARTDPETPGTRGLSIFLVEPTLPDGSLNPMDIVRLKEKLGVRSMASAEIIMTDTRGKLVGEEGKGFKIMTDMINLSRLYNAVAAVAGERRALIEAYQFLKHRHTFGKNALDHALVRDKLTELGARTLADFYLTWRTIIALDRADNGDEREQHLVRLLTPMTKKATAENCVYNIRESMELMGGMGYIEDGVMPKIMRDAMVLPIWEGAGNIMVLDMLRALRKSKGVQFLCEDIKQLLSEGELPARDFLLKLLRDITSLLPQLLKEERATIESSAKPVFEQLTLLYQIALLHHYTDEFSAEWTQPALDYLIESLRMDRLRVRRPNAREVVEGLIAWEN